MPYPSQINSTEVIQHGDTHNSNKSKLPRLFVVISHSKHPPQWLHERGEPILGGAESHLLQGKSACPHAKG